MGSRSLTVVHHLHFVNEMLKHDLIYRKVVWLWSSRIYMWSDPLIMAHMFVLSTAYALFLRGFKKKVNVLIRDRFTWLMVRDTGITIVTGLCHKCSKQIPVCFYLYCLCIGIIYISLDWIIIELLRSTFKVFLDYDLWCFIYSIAAMNA